jgi:hypothetical protein
MLRHTRYSVCGAAASAPSPSALYRGRKFNRSVTYAAIVARIRQIRARLA